MASLVEKVEKAATKAVLSDKQAQLTDVTNDATKDRGIQSNFGVLVEDTDDNWKAGVRGPTLIEDFHAREKVSHFDHERIPERVVHARGFGVHGVFKLHTPIPEVTYAPVLNDTSRTTSIFVRFSTVAGSRGSADTVRDVRGFALRFYTTEGNWDIVGNNNPVFFIQEGIKFPDLIHSVKPEPHNEVPQAQSAHDNFWDFISYTPEAMHHILWHMSDRNIPRSYRMMQGFGVHSFMTTNADGKRSFVKFHWTPKLGTHGLVWDEALKLAGQDPDFHRRDIFDAIEAGAYPEYDFGVQVVPEEKENDFDFDLLDPTKIIPEDLVPVQYIGTLTLNSNVAEYFPETEQVAYCTQNMIPGIGHSNDPLLAMRSFSYFDTQISRLGGPNFSMLPINRPIGCPVFNFSRDGMHRHLITKSKVNYWPNRFGTPHPVPKEKGGYHHEPTPIHEGTKTRARGPKFAEHYDQATLFWNSMSDVEKQHIVSAFTFELSKVEDKAIRERMIEQINMVDNTLAGLVSTNLSIKPPKEVKKNHGRKSAFLSMTGPHNNYTAVGRKLAIYVNDEFDWALVEALQTALTVAGIIVVIVGPRRGVVHSGSHTLETQFTFDSSRSTHFDAVFYPGGSGPEYVDKLRRLGKVLHSAREAYMHKKTVAASGNAVEWLSKFALPGELDAPLQELEGLEVVAKEGVVLASSGLKDFAPLIKKLTDEMAKHRAWGRDVDAIAA